MLLALTRPSRSADLSLDNREYQAHGVAFLPDALAKQSRQGKPLSQFFFPSFPDNEILCPITTLKAYEEKTASLRKGETKLFVAIIKPHNNCPLVEVSFTRVGGGHFYV